MKFKLFKQAQAVISRATSYSIPSQFVPILVDTQGRTDDSAIDTSAEWSTYPTEENLPEGNNLQPFSLICTCRNEKENIKLWLDSIASQTVLPTEIVIYDAASNDGTAETIESYLSTKLPLISLRLIKGELCSIARGRNLAISAASQEILLLTDAGCVLERHWCEFLLRGFSYQFENAANYAGTHPRTNRPEIVMGFYKLHTADSLASDLFRTITPYLAAVNPATFLPSARSLALKKHVWQEVGGFPEHLYRAGEDTLFDLKVKELNAATVFVPQAIVDWSPPTKLYPALRSIFFYSFGDGETMRLGTKDYLRHVRDTILLLLSIATFLILPWHLGLAIIVFAAWRYGQATYTHAQRQQISARRAILLPFLLRPVMVTGYSCGALRKVIMQSNEAIIKKP